jgi:hypothetical protein
VNLLESIGSSGSWFWICAVRMVRKVSKLLARDAAAFADVEALVAAGVGTKEMALVMR